MAGPKKVLQALTSIINSADEVEEAAKVEQLARAANRAGAGRKAADIAKAVDPMRMSEAIGKMNLEGKGELRVTQSDRTRVGGGNIGGPMFPGLQKVDPFYENAQAVWGVGQDATASTLINQSKPGTLWSTLLGSEHQLKTNPLVFNKLRREFTEAMKEGKLTDELANRINKNLEIKFGEGADIRDPQIWRKADTFDKRALLADVMMGQGVPPSKGGVAIGGEESGKGVIFKPSEILKRETEPLLLHPEHGGDVPTFSVGPRLFNLSGGVTHRPDLHPGFPYILQGEDMGVVFKPAPGEIAMQDFMKEMKKAGKKPGYYEWTMGLPKRGLPTQPITDEWLTYLQKAGYAKGGEAKPNQKASFEDRLREALEAHMAMGGEVPQAVETTPDVTDSGSVIPAVKDGGNVQRFDGGGVAFREPLAAPDGAVDPIRRQAIANMFGRGKEQLEREYRLLKDPKTRADILKRIALTTAGSGPDLVNLLASGADVAQTLVPALREPASVMDPTGATLGFKPRFELSSDEPVGGSEHLLRKAREAKLIGKEEAPIMEIAASLFGGPAASKAATKGYKALTKESARRPQGGLPKE